VRRALLTHGVKPPRARYRETIARAVVDIKEQRRNSSAATDGPTARPAVSSG
jgi:sulfate permease, SulP family